MGGFTTESMGSDPLSRGNTIGSQVASSQEKEKSAPLPSKQAKQKLRPTDRGDSILVKRNYTLGSKMGTDAWETNSVPVTKQDSKRYRVPSFMRPTSSSKSIPSNKMES